MSPLRNSEYYRRRADELRAAAGESRSADNRDTLLYFAADFERLADEANGAEQMKFAKQAAC